MAHDAPWIRPIAGIMVQSAAEDTELAAHALVREPRSGTHAALQGDVRKTGHPYRRRRGIADAHLAQADNVATRLVDDPNGFGTVRYTSVQLVGRHGWLVEEVACAAAYLPGDDGEFGREIIVHADVDDAEREAVLAAEIIDAASGRGGEVDALLPRHFARREADALGRDAVVGSENEVVRMAERGAEGLLYEARLQGQLLEPPKRSLGLGQVIDLLLQRRADRIVRLSDVERMPIYKCVVSGGLFHLHGDAADHEDNLVGPLGDVLVHPALQIGEAALDLVF